MKAPKIAIIMGSDSDFPIMKPAQQVLEELGIESETRIVSAHRMPDRMFEFAKQAESLGFNVIIAGAGGAAHLPGMVASLTVLPVVGVPVSATKLQGQDSLLSIVQMPAGIPVATVAIDNAKNAGILAAQIIGATDMSVRDRVRQWRDQLTADVQARADQFDPKMN
ncbi:MAG: 5-(carboxyamino)imidazole ribonucleotide mutase [Patiriisocius sp.]|jgi:5-(carboxyamino)imidazole ribonucleotide mutase